MGFHTSITDRDATEVCLMARSLAGHQPSQRLWGPVWWQALRLADKGDRVPLEYLCQIAQSTRAMRWDKGPINVPGMRKHLAGKSSPLWLYAMEAWATLLTHRHAQGDLDGVGAHQEWLLKQAPFLHPFMERLNKTAAAEPRRGWAAVVCQVARGVPVTSAEFEQVFSIVKATNSYTWVRYVGLGPAHVGQYDLALMHGGCYLPHPREMKDQLRRQNWNTGGLIRHLIQRGYWKVESQKILPGQREDFVEGYKNLLQDPWDTEQKALIDGANRKRSFLNVNLGPKDWSTSKLRGRYGIAWGVGD